MGALAALAVAPAVPARAFAALPVGASASAVAPPNLYTWGAMLARTRGTCSAEMLMETLPITRGQATGLMQRLMANNVIGSANAVGLAQSRSITGPKPVTAPRLPKVELEAPENDTDTDAAIAEADPEPLVAEAPAPKL